MKLPFTQTEALKCITAETARMSYPASMSRGTKPVVGKYTKALVESHFRATFPTSDVWNPQSRASTDFEAWHMERVDALAIAIAPNVLSGNKPESVAAKFINTFLHQLTKYEAARYLFPLLHLPLDSRVFGSLRPMKSPALKPFKTELRSSPYGLAYTHHLSLQVAFLELLKEPTQDKERHSSLVRASN